MEVARDSADTRDRLLAAARDEFTAHGLEGARVDRIAAAAGANKQRIYGHFGSKDKLFEAVIAAVMDEHIAALGLPTDDLADYVGRIYDFHREHPELLRLMQWEMLRSGQQSLPDEDRRAAYYTEKVDALAKTLHTESTGETAATLLILIGLAAWPHTLPQLTRLIIGPYVDDLDDAHDALRDRVVEFATQALGTTNAAARASAARTRPSRR